MRRRDQGRPAAPFSGRDDARRQIAHGAARLIAEGLTDFHAAKLKAARQLGMADSRSLPDNHEIEAALREHFALFSPDQQPAALAALRAVALELMTHLAEFGPWISGPVLTGTANEFSEIELELVGVEPKAFEMYLLNEAVEFEPVSMRPEKTENVSSPSRYRFEYQGAPTTISLFEHHAARQAAYQTGSPHRDRAPYSEADKLFFETKSKL